MKFRIVPLVCCVCALLPAAGVAKETLSRLMAEGKYREAIEHADKALPATARTADIWVLLGEANDSLGLTEKALACYLVSWRMNPTHYGSLLGAARVYNQLEQHENAQRMAQAALEQQFTAEASWEFARASIALGSPAEAKKALEKVIESDPGNRVANRALGTIYFDDKQYREAVPLLKKSLAVQKDPLLLLRTGQAYRGINEMDSALVYIERAVAEGVKEPGIVLDLARVYYGRGEFREAAQRFDKAIAEGSVTPLDHYQRAVSREKTGDAAAALAAYRAAVTAYGTSSDREALLSRLVVGKEELQQGKTDEALAHFSFIESADPAGKVVPAIHFLLADAHQAKKDVTRAIGSLEKAIARDEMNYEAYARLAGLYEQNKMADKAKATYEKMMSLSPDDPRVYQVLGTYNLNAQRYDEALQLFIKGNSLKKSADALEGIARSAEALNQYNRAREAALDAVSLDGDRIASRKVLANVFMRAKEYADARPHLEYLTQKEGAVKEHWVRLAECYEGVGEKDLLAATDRKIVAMDNAHVAAHRRLAHYELAAGNTDKAREHFRTVSILDPKDAASFQNLYRIARDKGDNDDALTALRRYLVLTPSDAHAHRDLGDMLYARKDFDGALESYRKVIALDPSIRDFYSRYAEVVIAKGLEQEVIKALSVLIESGDADLTAYTTLGMIYEKQKDYQKALDVYRRALQIDPSNAAVLSAYASCQAAIGDVDGAIITYEQTVMMDPDAVDEHRALGDLYMKQKRAEQAMRAYMRYLDKKPDPAVAAIAGGYAFEQKEWDKAARYLGMVRGEAANDFNHVHRYAEAAFHAGRFDVAVGQLSNLLTRNPKAQTRQEVTLMLARAHEATGNNREAARLYEEYVGLGVTDADAAFKSARLREEAAVAAAIKIYEANTKKYPRDARNFIRLGKIYARDESTIAASVPMLKRAAALADTVADVWLSLGQVYGELGQGADELAAYREYVRFNPQNPDVNKRIGIVLLEQNNLTEGMVYLETANAVNPNDPDIMAALARGYIQTNRRKEALDLLNRVKEMQPDNTEIREKLFESYVALGRPKEAEKEIAGLIQVRHDNAYILRYARFLREQGDLKGAETKVEDILAVDPENIEVLMLKGDLQRSQKRYDDAVETYKEISFIDPNNADALYERAETHRLQNRPQWATTFYQRVLRADPDYALAELGLARLAKMGKNRDLYKTHLEKARKINPRHPEILKEIKEAGW